MSEKGSFDALSEVFATLRLRSELYFHADLRGAFAVALPRDRLRIRFHLVRQGRCWLTPAEGPPLSLAEGDLAIVPNGAEQVLSSAPDLPPVPLGDVIAGGALDQGVLTHGSGEPRTRLLCGFCQFDEGIEHPLLANLPALLVLRPADLGAEPWTAAALRLLAMEADLGGQGTVGVLSRLLEIVFLQAVRRMTLIPEGHGPDGHGPDGHGPDGHGPDGHGPDGHGPDGYGNGYIAALADAQLSRALLAVHREPQVTWTIGALAKVAGMSRARFADRFTAVVGLPPIGYLTRWRLIKARALLANSDLGMEEIASRCGYASVPSFTRRFKQTFAIGPGAYRRSSRSID